MAGIELVYFVGLVILSTLVFVWLLRHSNQTLLRRMRELEHKVRALEGELGRLNAKGAAKAGKELQKTERKLEHKLSELDAEKEKLELAEKELLAEIRSQKQKHVK
ncbi:MAG: hypothetical protein HY393_04310 [Candidatus Diapherotrites archaeon]|nr:hypothetical protein [Candidatus Diapherotrites archaeon]